MHHTRRWTILSLFGASLLGAAIAGTAPAQAHGRVRGGVYFGVVPPVYAGPYPYPYHSYAPPPYYAAPAASGGCYAGPYVCPLDAPAQLGAPCSCPTAQGPVWGRAR